MIDEQKGSAEAESLLEDLGFDTLPIRPHEVVKAIDSDDFRVVMEFQNFNSDKILGKAEGNTLGALVYINANIPDQGRQNFTAAHEIGHVCMHIMSHRKMTFSCGSKELNNPFDDPIEKEANGFASGFLFPRNLVAKLTDNDINWKNISKISTVCEASLEATFRRMSFLDNSPIALVIHNHEKFRRFVSSDNFGFYLNRTPLSTEQKSLCIDVKEEGYPSEFDMVDASDWVNPNSKGYLLGSIYSSSIILNDGFVYTLLTYDEECYLEETDTI